jgi:hypothetical protein
VGRVGRDSLRSLEFNIVDPARLGVTEAGLDGTRPSLLASVLDFFPVLDSRAFPPLSESLMSNALRFGGGFGEDMIINLLGDRRNSLLILVQPFNIV